MHSETGNLGGGRGRDSLELQGSDASYPWSAGAFLPAFTLLRLTAGGPIYFAVPRVSVQRVSHPVRARSSWGVRALLERRTRRAGVVRSFRVCLARDTDAFLGLHLAVAPCRPALRRRVQEQCCYSNGGFREVACALHRRPYLSPRTASSSHCLFGLDLATLFAASTIDSEPPSRRRSLLPSPARSVLCAGRSLLDCRRAGVRWRRRDLTLVEWTICTALSLDPVLFSTKLSSGCRIVR